MLPTTQQIFSPNDAEHIRKFLSTQKALTPPTPLGFPVLSCWLPAKEGCPGRSAPRTALSFLPRALCVEVMFSRYR